MLVRERGIRLGAYHWERLLGGMNIMQIKAPKFFREELEREVMRSVQRNKLERLCRVRVQVYGGDGGLYDGDDFAAGYLIEVFPLEPAVLEINEIGLTVGIAKSIKCTGPYANIKISAALPYALAARQAKAEKWNDALLLNEHGNIAESTIANIFWVREGKIYTPPLTEGCVAGVIRRHLLTELPKTGYLAEELPFSLKELERADGIFLTNAIRGLRWIKSVDSSAFGPSIINELYTQVLVSI
jgi:branched-chain amino acid aminotransferase